MKTLSRLLCLFAALQIGSAGEKAFTQPLTTKQDSLIQLASRLYNEGAYQTLLDVSRSDSSFMTPKLCYYRGMSCAALYDYPRAQDLLGNAIQGDSSNVMFRFQYGKLLSQAGFLDEAADAFTQCIALDSMYLPASFQLGLLLNARKDNPQKETEIFSFLVRRNPKDFLSHYYLGDALKRMLFIDSGMFYIRRSVALNPRYFPSLVALANNLNSNKEYKAALEYYKQAESIRPRDKDIALTIGECLRKLKEYHPAINYYRRAITLDPANPYPHAQLAYTYFTIGKYDSSIAEYSRAIEIDSENPLFYKNLALAYEKIDSVKDVIHAYEKAIEALHGEEISYVYKTLALFYDKKRMYREEAEAYERVFQFNQSNHWALYWAGHAYAAIPDKEKAIHAFERHLRFADIDTTILKTEVQKDIEYFKKKLK